MFVKRVAKHKHWGLGPETQAHLHVGLLINIDRIPPDQSYFERDLSEPFEHKVDEGRKRKAVGNVAYK